VTRLTLVIAGIALAAACGASDVEPATPTAAEAKSAPEAGASLEKTTSPEAAEAEGGLPNGGAAAGTWIVDKATSWVGFTGTQTGKEFRGRFLAYDAAIELDPNNLAAAKIEVEIDMTSAKTGDKQRDDALPGKDWFAAAAFPKAHFRSRDVFATGSGTYEARGSLTIREVTRDLALPFRLSIDGNRASADGMVVLVRTDYGVGQGEFATGEWVGLDVKVSFHIEATR